MEWCVVKGNDNLSLRVCAGIDETHQSISCIRTHALNMKQWRVCDWIIRSELTPAHEGWVWDFLYVLPLRVNGRSAMGAWETDNRLNAHFLQKQCKIIVLPGYASRRGPYTCHRWRWHWISSNKSHQSVEWQCKLQLRSPTRWPKNIQQGHPWFCLTFVMLGLSISSSCYCDIKYSHCNKAPMKARKHFSLLNSATNKCALVKTNSGNFITKREPNMIYIYIWIYIYKSFHRVYSPTLVSTEHTAVSNSVTPPHVWALVGNASRREPTNAATDISTARCSVL